MTEPREEIVKKAFLQFLNRGYKACSLKTLEQATGLTKGAFYYYFKDKKEILEAGMVGRMWSEWLLCGSTLIS